MADQKLTDRTLFGGTLNILDLIHVVDVSDTSQDPAGSSYKLKLDDLKDFINENIYNTDGTLTSNRAVAMNTFSLEFTNGILGFGSSAVANARIYVVGDSVALSGIGSAIWGVGGATTGVNVSSGVYGTNGNTTANDTYGGLFKNFGDSVQNSIGVGGFSNAVNSSAINYGGYFSASGSSVNNYGVYSASGNNRFVGNTAVGTIAPLSNTNFLVSGDGTATWDFRVYTSGGNYALNVLDSNGYLGVGILTATAKLHVVGSSVSSADYSLKVQNSASANLFNINNTGYLVQSAINSDIYGDVANGSSFSYKFTGGNGATNHISGIYSALTSDSNYGGQTTSAIQGYAFVSGATNQAGILGRFYNDGTGSTAGAGVWGRTEGANSVGESYGVRGTITMNNLTSNIYAGHFLAQSTDATPGADVYGIYAEAFDNSGGANQNIVAGYFKATAGLTNYAIKTPSGGGNVSLLSIPTGNAGLVTGDLYVDTAVNILANGDLVVGRKV